MNNIHVLENKCVGCGLCLSQCPFGAIHIENKKAVISSACTMCGACINSCKFDAIFLEKDEVEYEDISNYKGIWVFAEQKNGVLKEVVLELLGQAKNLAKDLEVNVTAVFLGEKIETLVNKLIAYGADEVLYMEADWLKDCNEHIYGEIMIDLINVYKPEIILMGATSYGRSLAPYISSTLKTGLTADCTILEIDKEERLLLQTRPAFGGNLMATIVCPNTRPQMSTVRPRVFKAMNPDYTKTGKTTKISAPRPIKSLVKKIKSLDYDSGSSLSDADIIVGVGKGIGNKKNIELAEELAKVLGGALGSSRPVVDEGWMPYSQQIGQTGKTVSPKLYIACGISGAIQHIAGMAEIETVVAINNDPDAPIFQSAHYKIVGDCVEILPQITAAIKSVKSI
ncbi:electron transfer flavoprotein subunit alpha [Clostridiaceae bacterium 35-E11]